LARCHQTMAAQHSAARSRRRPRRQRLPVHQPRPLAARRRPQLRVEWCHLKVDLQMVDPLKGGPLGGDRLVGYQILVGGVVPCADSVHLGRPTPSASGCASVSGRYARQYCRVGKDRRAEAARLQDRTLIECGSIRSSEVHKQTAPSRSRLVQRGSIATRSEWGDLVDVLSSRGSRGTWAAGLARCVPSRRGGCRRSRQAARRSAD